MNLFRRNETKKSDFEIEEDDQEQGNFTVCVECFRRLSKAAQLNVFTFIHTDSAFLKSLQVNLSRLIAYAESADVKLQREVMQLCDKTSMPVFCVTVLVSPLKQVAEKLANEAVKSNRQVQLNHGAPG